MVNHNCVYVCLSSILRNWEFGVIFEEEQRKLSQALEKINIWLNVLML